MPLHTEHLANVRPVWVLSGWLVAVAASSLVAIVLGSFEPFAAVGASEGLEARWALISIAVGFAIGGFSVGYREVDAPVLTGVAIGLTSLLAWLPLNVLIDFVLDIGQWAALTPALTVLILIVQMATAVAGAWIGHSLALRGDTALID